MTDPVPAKAPSLPEPRRVALVHDWLTGMRGGEKCLEVLAEIFPGADLFTLLHVPGSVGGAITERHIRTSFIQNLPAAPRLYRWALPLFPRAVESFDLGNYDLVLSSSHCVAKGAVPGAGALSVCYCHTPMRYVWDRFDDYFGHKPWPLRQIIGWQAAHLRAWDRRTASRVHLWLANATVVARRIRDYYGVPADRVHIIPPPVDTTRFADAYRQPAPEGFPTGSYDLVVSALVAYKRIDLAVTSAIRAGRTLVVVGTGPEGPRLEALARDTRGSGRVHFARTVSDEALPVWYAHCRSFVFPGLEDFGITPLEATAAGRPVVAFRAGGALDTIREGLNGVFFDDQHPEALVAALADPRLDHGWDRSEMIAHAETFGRERYRAGMIRELATAWADHGGARR